MRDIIVKNPSLFQGVVNTEEFDARKTRDDVTRGQQKMQLGKNEKCVRLLKVSRPIGDR